tara:strand:- start:160 stop:351 length:192 start_codon:yes stop_codon:yes gene_type:complete
MSLANLALANDLSYESGVETITVNVNEADAKTMTGVLTVSAFGALRRSSTIESGMAAVIPLKS